MTSPAAGTHDDLDVDVSELTRGVGHGVLQHEAQLSAVRRHLIAPEARRQQEVEVRLLLLLEVAELAKADSVGGGVDREAVDDGRAEAACRQAEVVRVAKQRANLE